MLSFERTKDVYAGAELFFNFPEHVAIALVDREIEA